MHCCRNRSVPSPNPAGMAIQTWARIAFVSTLAATWVACGPKKTAQPPASAYYYKAKKVRATPAPAWVKGIALEKARLCGFGVAGAGFNEHSPYPKKLSEERAVLNLAGILGTQVQEAIVDRQTTRSIQVEVARALTVDEALVERVRGLVETEFWLDANGEGPFAAKMFTYAHACMDANVAADTFQLDAKALKRTPKEGRPSRSRVPAWIAHYGRRADGRLCAVGFSLPMFHPDKTFQAVVEDIRGQLAEVLQTFVSSYFEEFSTEKGSAFEAMTVATTQAVSKGAVVTHYWYDLNGVGPFRKARTTYGWGCIYPVKVLRTTVAEAQKQVPEDEKKIIERVRQRAASAFADLEAEEKKHEKPQGVLPRKSNQGPTPPANATAEALASDSAQPTQAQPSPSGISNAEPSEEQPATLPPSLAPRSESSDGPQTTQ